MNIIEEVLNRFGCLSHNDAIEIESLIRQREEALLKNREDYANLAACKAVSDVYNIKVSDEQMDKDIEKIIYSDSDDWDEKSVIANLQNIFRLYANSYARQREEALLREVDGKLKGALIVNCDKKTLAYMIGNIIGNAAKERGINLTEE